MSTALMARSGLLRVGAAALALLGLFAAETALAQTSKPSKSKPAGTGTDIFSGEAEGTGGDYGEAFTDPVQEGQKGAPAGGSSADKDALTALTEQGSFPVRLHVGEGAEKGWDDDPKLPKATPSPVAKRFKIKDCEFTIRTGEFGLRQYTAGKAKPKGKPQFVVSADALQRFSVVSAAAQDTVYLSATTELVAAADPASKALCSKAFKGRRVGLGKATIGKSTLDAIGSNETRYAGRPMTDPAAVPVFLTWDDGKGELSVEEASGLPPALESAVFAVQGAAGDYGLTLTPVMELAK